MNNDYYQQAKGLTSSGTNWFMDEYGQVTKVVGIIAQIERCSVYMYFH